MHELVGVRVMHRKTKAKGFISNVDENKGLMKVIFFDVEEVYRFPDCLANLFYLADEKMQEKYVQKGKSVSFNEFKKNYTHTILDEINYLKKTGGKRYRIIDGELLHTNKEKSEKNKEQYMYSFETDTELHFPDDTAIKIWNNEKSFPASVVSCEDFNIVIRTLEFFGEKVEVLEFTAEPWQLLEGLVDRLYELNEKESPIAYELACNGMNYVDQRKSVGIGQNLALKKATTEPITFIWGPPGTGKTTTLAKISLEHMLNKKRVLMLSYSNVSVDGAILKVAEKSDYKPGKIMRYGYPRVKELIEHDSLTSYAYVLKKNKKLYEEYLELRDTAKKLNKNHSMYIEIKEKMNKIRERLLQEEKRVIKDALFIATTVSKALVDKAIYSQKFDVVIFDEASMAYIPQIIFASSLAKSYFCCIGDFRQLSAIVQNPKDNLLKRDIFEYTGITSAVDNGYGHEWLVMLNYQYRMHPEIARFVSENIYDNLLHSSGEIYEQRQLIADISPIRREPMGLIDLSSTYSVCKKTTDGSRVNLLSAMMCIKLAEITQNDGKYKVAIITPYSAQAKLILSMLRDLQEQEKSWERVRCATVHQFQGSETPIVIFDAVDCYRMTFPGSLLTSKKNDSANRLFNVALTRTQGKFLIVANKDYFFQKKISKELMFTKALERMIEKRWFLEGEELVEELGTFEDEEPKMFFGDRDEVDSWERFLQDIKDAKKKIIITMPGPMDDDEDAIEDFIGEIKEADKRGVKIEIIVENNFNLSVELKKYIRIDSYVIAPISIIDQCIIWYGEPLTAAEFISEGKTIETKNFPCFRFKGKHAAKMVKAVLEISTAKKE